jgi:predicted PurR-regulated permease PerM
MSLNHDTANRTLDTAPQRSFVHTALVVALGAAGLFLCYKLMIPFLTPLAVAFVLAVLFAPFHNWIATHIRSSSLAAFVSVLVIAGTVLALLTLLLTQLIREAAVGADLVRTALEGGIVQKLLAAHPKVAPALQAVFDRINPAGLATDAASWLTNISATFLRGSVVQVAGALLTLFLLFYFLRDRREILAAVRSFLPFNESETALLFGRAVDTIHATVYGVVITGALMGLLGGVIFAAVGLPAPLLWGLVMAVFAILPVLGIGMVWIPAALFLALDGEWGRALIVAITLGALTAADTVVYPYLVGNRMKLHTAVTFIAAVGGLIVFGPVGFILGPLVVTTTVAFKDIIWARLPNSPPAFG